jgi:transcriptional regulator with GAF, ATPase, and Fis domain
VLGGTEEKTADVRIVAATNRDLTRAIKKRQFREDLYYRLQVLEINIPPLRERKQDIRNLVTMEQECLKGKEMGKGSWETLENHDWPGNIRELKSVLKRAAILAGDTIRGEDIKNIINQRSLDRSFNKKGELVELIREEMKAGKNFWDAVRKPFLKRDINRSQVKEIIRKGLMEAGGRYMSLLSVFNLDANDYHKFMSFLSDHQLK